jgi:hypothetical protein
VPQEIKTFITAIGYLSILYVLVRPNSLGPQIVISVSTGFGNLIRAASGQPLVKMPTINTGG